MSSSTPDAEPTSLTRSTVRGVFWITAGRRARAPLSLLAVAILARLLTPADFGVVALGMIVVTLSNVLVDGSFGMILIQRKSINPALIGASLALAGGLAIIFTAAVILSSPLIEQQFDFPRLDEVLLVAALVLPVTAVTMVTTALLQRNFRFATLTAIQLVSQIAYTIVGVGLAFAGAGMWALVWAQVTSFVFEALAGAFAVRKQYRLSISYPALREVFGFGGMFTISKLLNWSANNADKIVVGRFFGPAELGFFTRASLLMKTARDLSGAGPIRVLFSSFAKIQHDVVRMRNAYLRALSITLIVSGLVSAFMIVNAKLVVDILLGPQWLPTVPLVQILFCAFLAKSAYVAAEAVPLALGLGGQSALRQGAQLLLVVLGATIGAQFGMVGAAIGVATAYWLFYFLCLLLVQRLIHPSWRDLLKVHLKGILVSVGPLLVALGGRWLIPAENLWSELVPAALFVLIAAAILLWAPASLITEDLVRARGHVWERVRPHLQRLGI